MKYIFIVNPNSGNAKHEISLSFLQSMFSSEDEIVLKITIYQFHAKELVQEAINENADVIVACGGDGTINEVASALVNKNIPLGIIPAGSGNGLAANLNIPKDINKAIHIIKNNSIRTIDVGRVEDNYFFSNLGFGIDAQVIQAYEQNQKRTIAGYFDASVKTLLNYKSKLFRLYIDDAIIEKDFYYLFCSNSNIAGYGISFTPQADLEDGLLDLLMIEDLDVFEQFYFSVLVLAKKIDLLDKARYKQVKKFTIESLDGNKISYQLDGEFQTTHSLKVKVEVLPKALKIIY
ncbi:lipid kinase, YegS/Rv2252/BmrU family [Chishuiella changwenlii]|uniref:Lipid kinase, YegS/Rv2252/BmrU family n=2 Tax=Chishuiella changwenlii TaxID=1434701 RepID=A0A1M6YRN5_9FLAO|nr:YegS/Rv2252/BmrU family lipid kinase [Chishuiella changwenlii]SHL20981.1 lipid kinase, YegS/Rv2252/BmrU family [Chishuiella changwenlii]